MENNNSIESYKKKVQGAGNIIYIIGIITIVADILVLKLHLDGTRASNYLYIIIMFIYGYFVFSWGGKIKKTVDKNTKTHLIVLSCISGALIILSSGFGEKPSILFVGLCYYSISALLNYNKLLKAEKLNNRIDIK